MIDFSSLFFLYEVPEHNKLKPLLVNTLRDNLQYDRGESLNVLSDYYVKYYNKTYGSLIAPVIQGVHENINRISKEAHDLHCVDYWTQIYLKNDTHGWHQHGVTFASIYYVNYTDDTPGTIFRYLNKEFSINVKEGQVLSFPGFLFHKSPPNPSDTEKIIISFNSISSL